MKVKVRVRLTAQNHEGWRLVMNAWGCDLLNQPRQPKVPYGSQLAASRCIYQGIYRPTVLFLFCSCEGKLMKLWAWWSVTRDIFTLDCRDNLGVLCSTVGVLLSLGVSIAS